MNLKVRRELLPTAVQNALSALKIKDSVVEVVAVGGWGPRELRPRSRPLRSGRSSGAAFAVSLKTGKVIPAMDFPLSLDPPDRWAIIWTRISWRPPDMSSRFSLSHIYLGEDEVESIRRKMSKLKLSPLAAQLLFAVAGVPRSSKPQYLSTFKFEHGTDALLVARDELLEQGLIKLRGKDFTVTSRGYEVGSQLPTSYDLIYGPKSGSDANQPFVLAGVHSTRRWMRVFGGW